MLDAFHSRGLVISVTTRVVAPGQVHKTEPSRQRDSEECKRKLLKLCPSGKKPQHAAKGIKRY